MQKSKIPSLVYCVGVEGKEIEQKLEITHTLSLDLPPILSDLKKCFFKV